MYSSFNGVFETKVIASCNEEEKNNIYSNPIISVIMNPCLLNQKNMFNLFENVNAMRC